MQNMPVMCVLHRSQLNCLSWPSTVPDMCHGVACALHQGPVQEAAAALKRLKHRGQQPRPSSRLQGLYEKHALAACVDRYVYR